MIRKKTISSPLRYPGGKSRVAIKLYELFPENIGDYREPFVGGASVFMCFRQKRPTIPCWINDLYTPLYEFWLECQTRPKDLVDTVRQWKQNFTRGRGLYTYVLDQSSSPKRLHRAAAFFVLNRITFSGLGKNGGYSESAFEKRFTNSSIQRLQWVTTLFDLTLITNYGYQNVIFANGENVFLFLDPPYYSARKSKLYGVNGELHKNFDHQVFASLMRQVKHKWLITYDDCDYIKNLFSFANIRGWDTTYGMRSVNKQVQKELVITNY